MKGGKKIGMKQTKMSLLVYYIVILLSSQKIQENSETSYQKKYELPSFKSSNDKLENMKKMPFVISKTISCQIISLTLKCTSI